MFKPKDYDKAMVGNYMKFQDGQNRFRVLSDVISGYSYWTDKNGNVVAKSEKAGGGGTKPMRFRTFDEIDMEARGQMKGFAAMIVWNYQVEKVQILEVTQVGVMNALEALVTSKSWSDIRQYDIVITRDKMGPNPIDVEYSVMPEPKEKLNDKVLNTFKATKIRLDALYDGEDPFSDTIKMSDEDLDAVSKEIDAEKA